VVFERDASLASGAIDLELVGQTLAHSSEAALHSGGRIARVAAADERVAVSRSHQPLEQGRSEGEEPNEDWNDVRLGLFAEKPARQYSQSRPGR
jgi:hypothetical protein